MGRSYASGRTWLRSPHARRAAADLLGRSRGPDRLDDSDDDLVAAGADLAPGTLLAAYRAGMFPMPSGTARRPDVLVVARYAAACCRSTALHVSRSLRRSARDFEIRVDTAFDEVIDACADPAPRQRLDRRATIRAAYLRLHELGWVHSVETWRDGRLAGGLYGVAHRRAVRGGVDVPPRARRLQGRAAGAGRLLDDEFADRG